MRELVFDLVYEHASSPLAQLFDDPAGISATSVGGCIETDEFWRLERFNGSADALSQRAESELGRLLSAEAITPDACQGTINVEVLKQASEESEVYYHFRDVHACESVATLAAEYVGANVLFEVERTADRETWAVMMETEDGVGLFYDAVQVSLRPGIRFQFGHIGQATERRTALFARKNLPAEQREALIAAVQQGYYERPRQITLDELSDQLDCPRSTLSYRLRTAESKLAKAFASSEDSTGLESFPRTPKDGDGS